MRNVLGLAYRIGRITVLFLVFFFSYAANALQAEAQGVTVEYTFSSDIAEIGMPLTVNYVIKGGSGHYSEIHWSVDEVTEHCVVNHYFHDEELTEPTGSFTLVPEAGDTLNVNVTCTDTETGVSWFENYSQIIQCAPSQLILASIDDLPDQIALNENMAFSYTVNGPYRIDEVKVEIWAFVRNDTYPDCVFEQTSDNTCGSIEFIPRAGNQLYIAVQGKDIEGHPFYKRTGRLDVDTEGGYDEVTIDYSFAQETAKIGEPFIVDYEIRGGSGQFSEIYYSMDEVTEHCCINYYYGGELSESKGTFTVIPESGETIDINISCTDRITGIVWSENYSNPIICIPNENIPIYISNQSQCVNLYEPLILNYSIGGDFDIDEARIEIWVFARNDIYPDCLYQESITQKNGTINYVPKSGEQLYVSISGKDIEGRPFYMKTNRININQENILNNCLVLPSSIQRIEKEAFAFVTAKKVYIPSGIEYIDKDAFFGSNVIIILGDSSYIENYAHNNGFEYIKYNHKSH